MQGGIFSYALLTILATGLLFAAYTDLRRRQIDNWLTAAIALSAPLFWFTYSQEFGGFGWSDVGFQLLIAVITFAVVAALFAIGMMGGGDVKLLTALSLWIQPVWFLKLVIIMALVGGVLTLIFAAIHMIRRKPGKVAVPYGIAISAAGLWVLANQYLPALQAEFLLGST